MLVLAAGRGSRLGALGDTTRSGCCRSLLLVEPEHVTSSSRTDAAIYTFAGRELGVAGPSGLAIEDSVPGARSAVAAGCVTIGNVAFVDLEERDERVEALYAAGVVDVVASWSELESMLT